MRQVSTRHSRGAPGSFGGAIGARLHAVQPGDAAKVELSPNAAHDLDQAELFLLSLDTEMLTADGPRAAYLLGLAEGHLANVIQRIREIAQ
jgi:hypothetical protein